MGATSTTLAVQRYLDELAAPAAETDVVVRQLLERAVDRLDMLCGRLLHRRYARLTRAPAFLDAGDVLGALVGRLLRALADVRPRTVRQFFGLAHRHMRWELNQIARRIDARPVPERFAHEPPDAEPPTASEGPNLQRILAAIEALPEDEREVFELVRIQGLTHPEAAAVLEVAEKTVQRRLRRSLLRLAGDLGDLGGLAAAGDAR